MTKHSSGYPTQRLLRLYYAHYVCIMPTMLISTVLPASRVEFYCRYTVLPVHLFNSGLVSLGLSSSVSVVTFISPEFLMPEYL